jgi:hypothetical protein
MRTHFLVEQHKRWRSKLGGIFSFMLSISQEKERANGKKNSQNITFPRSRWVLFIYTYPANRTAIANTMDVDWFGWDIGQLE